MTIDLNALWDFLVGEKKETPRPYSDSDLIVNTYYDFVLRKQTCDGVDYYDLGNKYTAMICCDGEEVKPVDRYIFHSEQDDNPNDNFKLTQEEIDICLKF